MKRIEERLCNRLSIAVGEYSVEADREACTPHREDRPSGFVYANLQAPLERRPFYARV